MKKFASLMLLGILATAGCSSNQPLKLEKEFRVINVGASSGAVMEALPGKGLLQTANAVSVYDKKGWSEEAGIVQFDPATSQVARTVYVQQRSDQKAPLLRKESVRLRIETAVPPEVLEAPYDAQYRQQLAILKYALDALVKDIRQFANDKATTELMGLGRTILAVGVQELEAHPRAAADLAGSAFKFEHPNLGPCQMTLDQEGAVSTIYVQSGAWADPLVKW